MDGDGLGKNLIEHLDETTGEIGGSQRCLQYGTTGALGDFNESQARSSAVTEDACGYWVGEQAFQRIEIVFGLQLLQILLFASTEYLDAFMAELVEESTEWKSGTADFRVGEFSGQSATPGYAGEL
jgi:hypothetical protein